jgi:hypothetical protein
LDYELCVLGLLREKLRATVIWVEGASKHGNPDRVLLGCIRFWGQEIKRHPTVGQKYFP